MTQPVAQGQAERTALAWGRTSLAVLANGVLLLAKNVSHFHGPVLAAVAAGLAALIAVAVYLGGLRRQRTLAQRPLPSQITASIQVQSVGLAVLLLIAITALALFL